GAVRRGAVLRPGADARADRRRATGAAPRRVERARLLRHQRTDRLGVGLPFRRAERDDALSGNRRWMLCDVEVLIASDRFDVGRSVRHTVDRLRSHQELPPALVSWPLLDWLPGCW